MSQLRNRGKAAESARPATRIQNPKEILNEREVGVLDVAQHLRAMFVPPQRSSGFVALDGLRACLCLLIMFYHSMVFLALWHSNFEMGQKVIRSDALAAMMAAPLCVDGFFVLTGFLLTFLLLTQPSSSFSVRDWLYRRVSRMLPMYIVVIFLYAYVALLLLYV